MATEISKKNECLYSCEFCHFNTSKITDYNRHIVTKKHIRNTSATQSNEKHDGQTFACQNCSKVYIDRTGLWRHKKKCQFIKPETTTNDKLIDYVMKENKEIKELILEIVKNGITNNNHSHNTNNSHNKAFNLNFFLNETCKNAMNITDFVDSIKPQLSDLIEVGELGYVEGISKLIVKNLNNLDETIRPIHCTDKKRETMYIKDEGEWNKEDEQKTKLKKIITRIADKNILLLPAFREKYPEYKNSSSKVSDKYDKMVLEVMTTDDCKTQKIVHNISRVTTVKS